MSNTTQDPKPDGAAFDDYFESLQKKADTLTTDASKASESGANGAADDDEEQRVVDEIESLCMNCHENVRFPIVPCSKSILTIYLGNHQTSPHQDPLLPRNYSHVLFLPTLQLQELRNPIRWRDPTEG